MIQNIKNFLLDLFFPAFCVGCKKEGTYLCYDCKATLDISEHKFCLCNKKPLRISTTSTEGKCQKCRNKNLNGLYSALPYKEKALTKKLIRLFKYKPYVKDLAKTLSEIINDHFSLNGINIKNLQKNSILVPVPLEKIRLKERGYNQSAELAKELSKILKIPVALDSLIKTKKTLPQMKLKAKERENNLKGVFKIKRPTELAGKKVFLVDDVYTTGSTMEECAKTLKKARVESVWGIVIAREG